MTDRRKLLLGFLSTAFIPLLPMFAPIAVEHDLESTTVDFDTWKKAALFDDMLDPDRIIGFAKIKKFMVDPTALHNGQPIYSKTRSLKCSIDFDKLSELGETIFGFDAKEELRRIISTEIGFELRRLDKDIVLYELSAVRSMDPHSFKPTILFKVRYAEL